jgi:predicted  nucleic acid-binding Zn-ribbon protein
MSLQDLFAYQEKDVRIKEIKLSIAKSAEKKAVEAIKVNFDEAKKKMLTAEAYADKIVSAYNDAVALLIKINSESEKLIEKLNGEENADEVLAKLDELKKVVADTVKKVDDLKNRSEKAIKDYVSAQNDGKKLKDEYALANEKYKAKVGKADEELKKLESEVASLRGKVDKDLLAQYDALSQNVTRPFAMAQGNEKDGYMCGGCFMSLYKSNVDQLNKEGKCHCDSCKRIVYKG